MWSGFARCCTTRSTGGTRLRSVSVVGVEGVLLLFGPVKMCGWV